MATSSRRKARNEAPVDDVDDLWKIASSSNSSEGESQQQRQAETYTLFVGQKQAGKSSLITAFHNPSKDDTPKPTVALEYLFARRSAGANQPKDIAHIWELGGGARLSSLVSVPITPQTISNAVITIVVDLSQPHNVIAALTMWLDLIRKRVDECIQQLRVTNMSAAEELLASATLRYAVGAQNGKSHPDIDVVSPICCPILVVANKTDSLKDKEPVERRVITQALRFICHQAGASLLTCGVRDKTSQVNLRSLLSSHLFKSASSSSSSASSSKKREVNPDKPIVVPAGSDNFDDILKNLPKGSDRFDFIGPRGISRDVMNSWSQIFAQYFGPSKLTDEDMLLVEDDGIEKPNGQTNEQAASSDFPEASVDEARAQRDALLEQYRKEAERKRRMELGGGRSSSDRKSKSSSRASVKSSSSRSAAAEAK